MEYAASIPRMVLNLGRCSDGLTNYWRAVAELLVNTSVFRPSKLLSFLGHGIGKISKSFNVLDDLASHYRSEVRPIAEEVIKHIQDDGMLVRKYVISYFNHLQPEFPEMGAEYIELFDARLDDPAEEVSSIAADVFSTYEDSTY